MAPVQADQKTKIVALLAGGGALVILLIVIASVAGSPAPEVHRQPTQAVSITVSAEAMKAAEQGDADAQFAVATSLLADPELNLAYSAKAVEFLQHAAEHGHKRAMLRLGQLYRKGVGALQNYTLAAKWIDSAAKAGEPQAMLELGRLYREGVGVARDPVAAYIWLNRAAAARDPDAIREREEVARTLTVEELRQAQHESSSLPLVPAAELKTATELSVSK
jgi:uncharacterized protein